MPCFVDNKIVTNFDEFLKAKIRSQALKLEREELIRSPIKELDSTYPALYIGQNEFSILKPGHDNLEIIGTDEATTCCILIFRHSSSGVVGMAHLDGSHTHQSVRHMFQVFKDASSSRHEGRYEMHMIGGFQDDKYQSINLNHDIIEASCGINNDIHIVNSCIFEENDVVRNYIHYPIITGVAVHLTTGKVGRVKFTYKGPDAVLRSAARSYLDNIWQIYKDGRVRVGPYHWKSNSHYFRRALQMDDNYILQNFSTSPVQESASFIPAMRAQLSFLVEHQNSDNTLFSDGKTRLFKWNSAEEQWSRVYDYNYHLPRSRRP